MSDALATRCSACATVFRVVPDQLRVSDGWVRCGRCSEVFNAAQALLDAQTGESRSWSDARSEPSPPAAAAAASEYGSPPLSTYPAFTPESDLAPESPFESTQVLAPNAGPDRPIESPPQAPDAAEPVDLEIGHADNAWSAAGEAAVAGEASETAEAGEAIEAGESAITAEAAETPSPIDPLDRPFDVEAMIDASVEVQQAPIAEPRAVAAADEAAAIDAADTDAAAIDALPARREPAFAPADTFTTTPSFVRRAEHAERWRRPGVRAALLGMVLLGLLGLAAQVAYVYRDLMAARLPTTRPVLEQACAWLGCTVGAARMIDGLTVESSGLLQVAQTDAYELSIALRNRTAIDLALPAVELSLTDSQGKLLARRVLRTAELGAPQPSLAAGRELLLQATLRSATEPVAGYTIELFYP